MIVDEILEAIGVVRRPVGPEFLSDLFEAFDRAVLFESPSKIARCADIDVLAFRPRSPDLFWSEHLALGTGGTCFSRVGAFAALTEALGFLPQKVIGSISSPRSHAAVLFTVSDRPWLVDVGYPLPEIRPLESGYFETALGSCALALSKAHAELRFVSGPEAGRTIDYALAPVSDGEFREAWESTAAPTSPFLKDVVLRRRDGHRVLRYFAGEIQILDAHSKTMIPLMPDRAAKLSEIFSIDVSVLRRAFAIVGEREPSRTTARVEAYREIEDAERVFAELGSANGYRRFLSGLGEATVDGTGPGRWRAVLKNDRGNAIVEEIELAPETETLQIRRPGGLTHTGFSLDRTAGEPRLVRYAELPDAREEFLRSDLGRGRIAGMLAMDLLAVSRGSKI